MFWFNFNSNVRSYRRILDEGKGVPPSEAALLLVCSTWRWDWKISSWKAWFYWYYGIREDSKKFWEFWEF